MKRIFFIFSLLLCLLSVPVTGFAAETDEGTGKIRGCDCR